MKQTNKMATLKRVLRYVLTKYPLACSLVFILILVSTAANVTGALFIQRLIDGYIAPYVSQVDPDFTPLLHALIALASIFMIGVLATLTFNKILIRVCQGTLRKIRDDLFIHMEALPIQFFDTHNHGDIMSIYTNDTDTLRQMISQSVPQVLVSLVTLVSVFIAMLTLSITLSLVSLAIVFIIIFASRTVANRSGKHFYQQQINLGKVNGFIEEMMEGQKVIKVFTHEQEAKEDFDIVNEELYQSARKANTAANMLTPMIVNLAYLSFALVSVAGGIIAIQSNSGLTIGLLASFLQLNRAFNQPLAQVSQQINFVIMALAGAERIFKLLDQDVETDTGTIELVNSKKVAGKLAESEERTGSWAWKHIHPDGSIEYVPWHGDVRFNNVTFSYNSDKVILHDIDLYAKPGTKIALVGATGAGKTTITNLINRFYDIQEGTILYDGIDIRLIKKKDLRRSLGIVLQDTHLFSGTIMDNIRYGKINATDEEVINAAKLANADEFIMQLEHGYQTHLSGDGGSLSQGQRQLLAIARAAIANPPVLILDEATSSIDTRTESIVQKGMDKLMEGRTVFVIAHRLSTIQNSDAIMVMDQGRIIERGNHDALLEKRGVYYQLYTGGFELE